LKELLSDQQLFQVLNLLETIVEKQSENAIILNSQFSILNSKN